MDQLYLIFVVTTKHYLGPFTKLEAQDYKANLLGTEILDPDDVEIYQLKLEKI